jgi:hypothetical protein
MPLISVLKILSKKSFVFAKIKPLPLFPAISCPKKIKKLSKD